MSPQVFEATIALAPEKARQALMTMTAASNMFVLMFGRMPSDEAMLARFFREARDLGAIDADIQWLIDAEVLDAEVLELWKDSNNAHA